MTGAQLTAARRRLGMTQGAFAQLCGVDRISVWRWQHDERPVPIYAETILSLLEHVKALEAYYDVPAASRLSTGSGGCRNGEADAA